MAKRNQTPPKSFEEALRELEDILTSIESGEVGLEESLTRYERGNFLIQHCRGVLGQAEKQIELLTRDSITSRDNATSRDGATSRDSTISREGANPRDIASPQRAAQDEPSDE